MSHKILLSFSVGAVCVAAAAAFAGDVGTAAPSVGPAALTDISGRWQGHFHAFGAKRASCTGPECNIMTLDVGRCGAAWCGVVINKDGGCGATALRLDGPKVEGSELAFEGSLKLAEGAEPYTVRATGFARGGDPAATLWLIGDTGGSLRFMRRTFPFEARLSRQGEPVCKGEQKTS